MMRAMEHPQFSGHSVVSLAITVILYIIAKFTLSEVAAVFTILAALSTILLNYIKYKQSKR
jgi:cell division protein FtsW (lipid II flippase)